MSFHIRPLKEFLVRPALPAALARLPEIGLNLMWSWNHPIRAIFRRLDPVTWKAVNHNPVLLLGRVSQEVLERAAADPRFLALYRKACDDLDAYMKAQPQSKMLVAYFSMEYGLLECLPIYSGGLGVLSGDHLKASSDAMIPLVGVGLLYQKGYFQQRLDPDGWQQERTPVNDFYSLPITPITKADGSEMIVSVNLPGAEVFVKVWRLDVGRVKLYLLDTNIPQNASAEHREITDQLYGGDGRKRMRQEIVLGIGGLRALKAVGLSPTLFHMNEGHSAFLAIERIRVLMAENKMTFEEAWAAARCNNVFTTHTPVPAGIDRFDMDNVREHLEEYCRAGGISFEQFAQLGHVAGTPLHEPFSMAILAMQTSAYRNAVSKLHGIVSREMWSNLFPNLPVWDVPITSVTNGVHLTSWINGDLANLYDQYLQPDWREGHSDAAMWKQTAEIPASEMWDAHKRRKRRLVAFVRERAVLRAQGRSAPAAEIERAQNLLDPEAFTIGFARRFATYKRATLLFRDLPRLKRILNNSKMPVQIVIAGKAHPQDVPGKTLIRDIVQFSRDPELAGRVVFVEDYGIDVAAEMVEGVDVWLNTPRRGEEASGTSGMKAGINGVLNLSILDGWFDEAEDNGGGWAIGERDVYSPDRDDAHAAAIYSLLENEIAPLYYQGRDEGVPQKWIERMRTCISVVSANYNCQRMVGEYNTNLYLPAHRAWETVSASGFAVARQQVSWNRKVNEKWNAVRFVGAAPLTQNEVLAGSAVPLRIQLDLAGLTPDDVKVEAVVGRVGPSGDLEGVETLLLQPLEKQDGTIMFGRDFAPRLTGRLGYSVRVSPNHSDDPLTRPCNSPMKWMS